MAQNQPISSFGIHQATIRDLDTYELFTMYILDSAEPDFSQEMIDLRGGSSAFPWASAPGEATGEIAITVKQFDAGILKFFSPYKAGAIIETPAGEVAGNVSSLTNVIGTSLLSAGGLASIAVDPAGALKFGDYILVATSATEFDIYVNTNIDDIDYQDDALKINTAPIVNPGSGGTVVSNGFQFTAGSDASALVAGNKAIFSARPISNYLLQHQIGKSGAAPLEFELTIAAEKIGGKIRVVRYPRCIAGGGAGLKFLYKDWATFETTIKLLQSAESGFVGLETIVNR